MRGWTPKTACTRGADDKVDGGGVTGRTTFVSQWRRRHTSARHPPPTLLESDGPDHKQATHARWDGPLLLPLVGLLKTHTSCRRRGSCIVRLEARARAGPPEFSRDGSEQSRLRGWRVEMYSGDPRAGSRHVPRRIGARAPDFLPPPRGSSAATTEATGSTLARAACRLQWPAAFFKELTPLAVRRALCPTHPRPPSHPPPSASALVFVPRVFPRARPSRHPYALCPPV